MESNYFREKPLDILILAAGLGTRMRSNLAKVLHRIDGRPLIGHVSRTAVSLMPRKIYTVVGHQGEDVKAAVLEEIDENHAEFPLQKEQLGTGDAVNSAREMLENVDSTLLVLSGDVPMIKAETLSALINRHKTHRGKGAACTVLTVELKDPTGYGRVISDAAGGFSHIVEQKDGNENELAVKEINSGIYCFDTKKLFDALLRVKNNNAQGEYYLTDVPKILKEEGEAISIYKHGDESEIEGINNRAQLAEMERVLRERTISKLMLDHGVTFVDPKSVYISAGTVIGKDTVIFPNVSIEGETRIGENCTIRSGTRIADSTIGNSVSILDSCVITNADVGNNCNIGPFAHLRPKALMKDGGKVGNFVEMKNTTLGKNSKANHLTYLGDASIGDNSNIGAGTITCNYDGKNKHRTEIGDGVRIGSDTMLVAPIKVGDGSATGAGSVVTKDVPENKLAVGAPARVIKSVNNDE
ncbi:MAG: bifunctional UDP-N-acetylglucosamine diphosphorylase/glucosamine-1-phosphate N-acetyltransferase GlmU [Acidobacteria bacterium]|nr:bifunctional UDP-N-acetylglucosamine diphosphorylase/glucosamine-1-phosphate N-acetyltransferase GlmU [Acidobacteriota bacterium]